MSDYHFQPNKKKVGIYLNDGKLVFWVQAKADRPPSAKLVAAVEAARTAFLAIYAPTSKLDKEKRHGEKDEAGHDD